MVSQPDAERINRLIKERLAAARAAVKAGDLDAALAECEAAWQLIPEPRLLWGGDMAADWVLQVLAQLYVRKSDIDKALETYRMALETPDGSRKSSIHLAIGRILFDRGEMEQARGYLQRAWDISEGRVFIDVPKKYREFIKGKPKLH